MRKLFKRVSRILLPLGYVAVMACQENQHENPVIFTFDPQLDRIWVGPDFWANRLQDWKLENGKIVCTTSSPNRNLHLLTRRLNDTKAPFKMSVVLAFHKEQDLPKDWIGMRLGAKGEFGDYRDDAVFGKGLDIGITTDQKLFLGNPETGLVKSFGTSAGPFRLSVNYNPSNPDGPLQIVLKDAETGSILADIHTVLPGEATMTGGISLVSHFTETSHFNATASAWFDEWEVSGGKVDVLDDHAYGPVLFVQYTLSDSILKLTAQLPPVGEMDDHTGYLEVYDGSADEWRQKGQADMDPLARTLAFRVADWPGKEDIKYRISYRFAGYDGIMTTGYFEGTVQKDPADKEEIVIAAFTGNNDLGFPNNDLIENVVRHNPDLLFFSGDQIYEGVGGYGVQRTPMEMAVLDYLRKWYMFGWTYRDLMRNRPSITIPDDHDVFHGNIWGANGKATPKGLTGTEAQDQGGYKMPPEFVNMVQATQTSHLPDPYDPAPVEQGIGVYYTSLNYGGVSFAIIEDRKFKSAPTPLLPEAEVWNGWPQNRSYDVVAKADHPDAKLLGDRQLDFLDTWAAGWSNGTWMKVLLSQTIFANVATLPEEETHDQNVPKLRIMKAGEYAENDRVVTDMDSNGWPQAGRNKALQIIRKGFALHIAGDQHLGSTIQYGVDDFRDAGFAICVPSVSNVWPRRWYPPRPGDNPIADSPPYTGDYEDGFGNKMTVYAVSNPIYTGRQPGRLFDRATGYGIIRLNRKTRHISLANWPRDVDPTLPNAAPYPGWPVMIDQEDNYARKPAGYLPEIRITGMTDPVIQVIREKGNEIIYTLRINGYSFRPKVFEEGKYTLKVGNPDREMKIINGLEPGDFSVLEIDF